MEIRQLRYAVRLAETLHFGRAARQENIAQSAFSSHVARLERELDLRLFDRSSHHVALTAAGEYFVEQAQLMLAQLDHAAASARALANNSVPTLRIGVFADAGGDLTQTLLSMYRELSPRVHVEFVELSMVDQLSRLLSEDVDIALVYGPFDDERILTRPILSEPRVAMLPKSHRLAEAKVISVDDLLDEPFVTAGAGAPEGWAAYWACDERRGEPGRVATTVRSAREGLMAAAWLGAVDTVPVTFARRSPHPGIIYVPLLDATPSTVVVARRRDDQRPQVVAFDLAVQRATSAYLHLDLVPGATSVTA